jgi:hypothetical protein
MRTHSLLFLIAVASAVLLATAAPALGSYDVRICDSSNTGADVGLSGIPPTIFPVNLCGPLAELDLAVQNPEDGSTVNFGEQAAWTVPVPFGLEARGISFDLAATGAWTRPYSAFVNAFIPNGTRRVADLRPNLNAGPVTGTYQLTFSQFVQPASIDVVLACEQRPGCGIADEELRFQHVTVNVLDVSYPRLGTASGPLVSGTPVRGMVSVDQPASDDGSGVLRTFVNVDGWRVAEAAAPGVTCVQHSTTYERMRPCPVSFTGHMTVDTNALGTGRHTLRLGVEDADHDITLSDPRTFEVDRPPLIDDASVRTSLVTSTRAVVTALIDTRQSYTSCRVEYGTTTLYGASASCDNGGTLTSVPIPMTAHVQGLSPATTYHFRFVATNISGQSTTGSDHTLTTVLLPPTATSDNVTHVTQTSALVQGSVSPNGSAVTSCSIEFGTSTAYGSSMPCAEQPGSGPDPVSVSATVSGLSPGTTYHARVTATGVAGTASGEDLTFTTPTPQGPVLVVSEATNVTHTTASVHATVNPNGLPTTCSLEVFWETLLVDELPCTTDPGSGTVPVGEDFGLVALMWDTTYDYVLVATNSDGTTTSESHSFTTPSL